MKSSLKLVALNTFTLHFQIENILQSNQSSLKWWIHSLFIFRSKTFYRANLLWNDEYIHSSFHDWKRSPEPILSEMKSSLKLVALNTFTLHFLIKNALQSTKSSLKWWKHSLFISRSKAFSRVPDFPDRPEFFSLRTRGHLWTVRPAFNFPDWLTWIFLFSVRAQPWLSRGCSTKSSYYRGYLGIRVVYTTLKFFVIKTIVWWNSEHSSTLRPARCIIGIFRH